jgi:hypothetical protein
MRLLLAALITLIGVTATAFDIPESGTTAPALGMQRPSVVTCTIHAETATQNSRPDDVVYYECRAVNGAVIPSVTFLVFPGSTGALWLKQLAGSTVDVRLEVVQ